MLEPLPGESTATTDVSKLVAQFELASAGSNSLAGASSSSVSASEVRDCVTVLLRAYGSLNRIDAARALFHRYVTECDANGATAVVFDTFLSLLAQQPQLSKKEALYVLHLMNHRFKVKRTAFTYLALFEMHMRLFEDCVTLWFHMRANSVEPNAAVLRLLMHGVILHDEDERLDFRFILDVTKEYLAKVEQRDTTVLERLVPLFVTQPDAAAEHAAWLLFELELRCVLDKVPLTKLVERAAFIRLLHKAAKSGDSVTASRIMAVMERHQLPATTDALSLLVWCFAAATEVEKAIDTLEEMSQRGLLDGVDYTKRWVLEALNLPMPKHYLALVAESFHTTDAVDRAYFRLERRKREGLSVSVHALDIVVLACARLGDEARAVETLEAYTSLGVHPRTQSYNALLVLCGGRSKARQHRAIFESMLKRGVKPNYHTLRVLIRQSVAADNIDEALEYLYQGPTFPGVRIDVEMILPILERAARVGDVDTVVQLCTYSLQCDIGIDGNVLRTAAARIRELGLDASAVEELIPTHEKVRGKYGVGRVRGKPQSHSDAGSGSAGQS